MAAENCAEHEVSRQIIRPIGPLRLIHPVTDILDMKPKSMEELTEVITAATFHPSHCNVFLYSSSRGCIKMGDMRASALCDKHAKGNPYSVDFIFIAGHCQALSAKDCSWQHPGFTSKTGSF